MKERKKGEEKERVREKSCFDIVSKLILIRKGKKGSNYQSVLVRLFYMFDRGKTIVSLIVLLSVFLKV